MRLLIIAVGKLKDSEERAMIARYEARLAVAGKPCGLGPIETRELNESRAVQSGERRNDEAVRAMKACRGANYKVALDVMGKSLSSEAFAKVLAKHANGGAKTCAFLIGGADGHGEDVLAGCDLRLSLGPLTLPHGLARVVLAEQLYRAATILSGHPYHRA